MFFELGVGDMRAGLQTPACVQNTQTVSPCAGIRTQEKMTVPPSVPAALLHDLLPFRIA